MISVKVLLRGCVFFYKCETSAAAELLRDAFIPMGAEVTVYR